MKNETFETKQTTIDFLLKGPGNSGDSTLFEFVVPAGARVPVTYYHEHFEETIYGLERIITFTVEGKAADIATGETCFMPREAIHN